MKTIITAHPIFRKHQEDLSIYQNSEVDQQRVGKVLSALISAGHSDVNCSVEKDTLYIHCAYPVRALPFFKTKIATDRCGNRIVKVSFPGHRQFSIQTNGNLPRTHRESYPDRHEIIDYILHYGTARQQAIVNQAIEEETR